MQSLPQMSEKGNLTLIQRARLRRLQEKSNELEQAAQVLVETVGAILDEYDVAAEWTVRAGQRVPFVRVVYADGELVFSYYSDSPLGLYVGVLCDECGGPTRAIIHTLPELADALESKHICPTCVVKREHADGKEF